MKRLFPIVVLTISLLALLAACGKEATPTANPGPASSAAQELKQAGQDLFDTFSASIETRDAAALHRIFVADFRERCTIEQMQETLANGDVPSLNAEVKTVFVDSENPSRALMQLALLDQLERNEAHASGFAFEYPFPMVREQGEWRLGFPILANASQEGCPFSGFSSNEEEVSVVGILDGVTW